MRKANPLLHTVTKGLDRIGSRGRHHRQNSFTSLEPRMSWHSHSSRLEYCS